MMVPATVADTAALLEEGGYVADTALVTTVHLAMVMDRPLFLEGEPGTGKTEIAKVLASGLKRRLVRLQAHEDAALLRRVAQPPLIRNRKGAPERALPHGVESEGYAFFFGSSGTGSYALKIALPPSTAITAPTPRLTTSIGAKKVCTNPAVPAKKSTL